jgi:hypothetical protein
METPQKIRRHEDEGSAFATLTEELRTEPRKLHLDEIKPLHPAYQGANFEEQEGGVKRGSAAYIATVTPGKQLEMQLTLAIKRFLLGDFGPAGQSVKTTSKTNPEYDAMGWPLDRNTGQRIDGRKIIFFGPPRYDLGTLLVDFATKLMKEEAEFKESMPTQEALAEHYKPLLEAQNEIMNDPEAAKSKAGKDFKLPPGLLETLLRQEKLKNTFSVLGMLRGQPLIT